MKELVGRRFKFAAVVVLLGAVSCVFDLDDPPSIVRVLELNVVMTGAALLAVVVDVLRPNRLRLNAEGFELTTTWGGRRRVAWTEVGPAYFVTFEGRGGRKHQYVRCSRFAGRGRGSREVAIPSEFAMTPLALLMLINDARAEALGEGREA